MGRQSRQENGIWLDGDCFLTSQPKGSSLVVRHFLVGVPTETVVDMGHDSGVVIDSVFVLVMIRMIGGLQK